MRETVAIAAQSSPIHSDAVNTMNDGVLESWHFASRARRCPSGRFSD